MDLHKKTIFILTGASRGIGKSVAVECCRKFAPKSMAILLARSNVGLEETHKEILALNNRIVVKVYSIDLNVATTKNFEEILDQTLSGVDLKRFRRAFIVHNVGTVGDVSKTAKDLSDIDAWQKYFHLNLFGVIALNAEFMKRFNDLKKIVINITSKAGIIPFPGMAEYCAGKAAREMYFRVLALEEKDTVVLSYSPGTVDTDLTKFVQTESVNKELQERLKRRSIITTEQTAAKFVSLLEEYKFESGDHVGYCD